MSTVTIFAAVGWKALLLLYIWLGSSIIASELSRSKGYGEKPGLGTGLLLTALAPIVWLLIPPKDDLAEWHTRKPWQRRRKPKESEMAAAMAEGGGPATKPGREASTQAEPKTHDQEVEASAAESGEPPGTGGAGSRPGE